MKKHFNLDNFVNYKAEALPFIKKAHLSGDQLIGCCPFHQDTNPSFSMNVKKGLWKCFGCQAAGNFVQFYALTNNITTKEAFKEICKKYRIKNNGGTKR